jgi:A/G-specific adenine glycosylase
VSPRPDPAALLAWYDRHGRSLPWRGRAVDPYRVWLSEIMLQQTTVAAVIPYFLAFVARWPTLQAFAAARDEEVMAAWAGLGYYRRARQALACARRVIAEYGGRFPHEERALLALPGIGPYTAAAIAAIAFDERATVVDGNVERVVTRLHAVEEELPGAKARVRRLAEALTPDVRPGDHAQAIMDLGATICTPKKPACALCPWREACAAFARGDPHDFPRKAAKKARPLKRGAAFWVTRGDDVLLRRRPPNGLLGGMAEVPGTAWSVDFDMERATDDPPLPDLRWGVLPGAVRHGFTHFELEVTVLVARLPAGTPAPPEHWWHPLADLAAAGLPTIMRKIAAKSIEADAVGGQELASRRASRTAGR